MISGGASALARDVAFVVELDSAAAESAKGLMMGLASSARLTFEDLESLGEGDGGSEARITDFNFRVLFSVIWHANYCGNFFGNYCFRAKRYVAPLCEHISLF